MCIWEIKFILNPYLEEIWCSNTKRMVKFWGQPPLSSSIVKNHKEMKVEDLGCWSNENLSWISRLNRHDIMSCNTLPVLCDSSKFFYKVSQGKGYLESPDKILGTETIKPAKSDTKHLIHKIWIIWANEEI